MTTKNKTPEEVLLETFAEKEAFMSAKLMQAIHKYRSADKDTVIACLDDIESSIKFIVRAVSLSVMYQGTVEKVLTDNGIVFEEGEELSVALKNAVKLRRHFGK